jgi:hypothetical protein
MPWWMIVPHRDISRLSKAILDMDHNKRISLSPDVLLEIEEALNSPLFFGIAVGVTLNDMLTTALYDAGRVWCWRRRVKDVLRLIYQRFHQPAFGSRDFSQYKGRIVLTWIFDVPHLKELVLPIAENYDSDDYVLLGSYASMRGAMPDKDNFILWDELPKIDMKVWRKEFDRCLPTWKNRLNQVLEKHSIPSYVVMFLLSRLQVQTQRLMAANQFLDDIKPKVIVTEYDRNAHSSCLILAAMKRNIPAITMIHGGSLKSYPSYGYVPILSNFACCWGDLQKQKLIEHGVGPDKLVVTGCQSQSQMLEVRQDEALSKIGVPMGKAVVLLATSPIKLEDRKEYASSFCVAMTNLPEVTGVVRLHPAENLSSYKELVAKFPEVKFLPNEAMTLDESLAASDIVVNHDSCFGGDALLKGKLLVILDVLNTPMKIGKEMVELAGCPCVKGSGELESVIRQILVDVNYRNELHAKAEKYSLQYCSSYGQDAVRNVCRLIDQAIESSEKKTGNRIGIDDAGN